MITVNDMKLGSLLDAIETRKPAGPLDVEITGIATNSRLVNPGNLFVAIRGTQTDGHLFMDDAIARGAAACVCEAPPSSPDVPCVIVENSSKALAALAARFFGNPAGDLLLCGVTGTNGKTSTAHLLRSICETSSWGPMGIIGTVGHGAGGALEPAIHTTPDPVKLHELFAGMKKSGCRGVVMEVSSHAVRQQRTWGLEFVVGILTNVTHDHLDFHKTFEDYVSAKREFCLSLVDKARKKKPGFLVYGADNDVARGIGASFPGEAVSAGLNGACDVSAERVKADLNGTDFILRFKADGALPISLRLLGRFSVQNALCAAAAAFHLGIGTNDIKRGLEAVENVPGRFEAFGGGERPVVIVDYCHTPDSLERVLTFCLDLKPKRLITVFGCGGDRDKSKRPVMGRIAQQRSHTCYVTNDNPRTEDPSSIIAEILSGMDRSREGLIVEMDRRQAIRMAVRGASRGDLVAVCGKGHEDYQIIGTQRHHFDDREEARKALAEWRGE